MALILTGLSPSRADDEKPQEITGWGVVTDPDGDCTVAEDDGRLTIRVPGSLHGLYPLQQDEKKRSNAPWVLQELKGTSSPW